MARGLASSGEGCPKGLLGGYQGGSLSENIAGKNRTSLQRHRLVGRVRGPEINARNARPVVDSHSGSFTKASGEEGIWARRSALPGLCQSPRKGTGRTKAMRLRGTG